MSSLGSPNPFFIAGKKAYEVERSLRFNDDDSPLLTRTFGSAGNRKTWTFSCWLKRSNIDTYQGLLAVGTADGSEDFLGIDTSNRLNYRFNVGSDLKTLALLRDSGAWYHIVVVADTTQSQSSASASDSRLRFYINGVQQTDWDESDMPSQNFDFRINNNVLHYIGEYPRINSHLDGYLAEVNFIDGYAYDASYFAETNAITGQWNPKKYVGSYGTNGFYLNFSDNSGTTATTLGKDSSGNGNNFTPNNFSVDAGESNDSLEDTPTNNFPTINPLDGGTNGLLSNGNTRFKPNSSNGGNFNVFYSNFAMRSGKWYFEVLIGNTNSGTNSIQFGIGSYKYKRDSTNQNGYPGTSGLTFLNVNNSSSDYRIGVVDGSQVGSSVSTASTNDVYGIAFDADNKKVYFYKNGSAEGESSGYNVTDVGSGDFFFFSTLRYSTGGSYTGGDPTLAVNFGQRAFSYTAPTGYKKLNSANLPDPTIKLPNKHFNTLLWTGNGNANRAITGLNFAPDWIWFKSRDGSTAWNHQLSDTVRGLSAGILNSDKTDAERGTTYALASFDSNGFTIQKDSNNTAQNINGTNYVGWNWDAGDTDGKTYTVKVVSDSGNKYRFDDFGTSAVTLDLAEGGTYIFDQSDASNATHPLRFYTAADKTGGEYTTGVITAGTPGQAGAYTQIVVAASAPTLYYQCSAHANMGGQANTNSTLGSSNFDGTLQTTVKANPTAGFSIVSYTVGNFSGMTMGHGLGVAPDIAISKKRSGTSDWSVQFINKLDNSTDYMFLNKTDAKGDTSTYFTSTTVKDGFGTGQNGSTIIQYVFSEVEGYSKIGAYTGNGSSDGTFVYTGFRPAWVMVKRSSGTQNWRMFDNKRNPFNDVDLNLQANTSGAEFESSAYNALDFLSNGFKLVGTNADEGTNQNGQTYIYLAFAESPFKNARAR